MKRILFISLVALGVQGAGAETLFTMKADRIIAIAKEAVRVQYEGLDGSDLTVEGITIAFEPAEPELQPAAHVRLRDQRAIQVQELPDQTIITYMDYRLSMKAEEDRPPAMIRVTASETSVTFPNKPDVGETAAPSSPNRAERMVSLRFDNAPVDLVLDHYGRLAGKTVVTTNLPTGILVSIQTDSIMRESVFLQLVEGVMQSKGVRLEPRDDGTIEAVHDGVTPY